MDIVKWDDPITLSPHFPLNDDASEESETLGGESPEKGSLYDEKSN